MAFLEIFLDIIKNWWWLFFPILLYQPTKFMYFWWVNWELYFKTKKWIMLEIIPPKEILKPFRAMDDIFQVLWGVYDSPNWREQWCEGQMNCGPYWISFEIVSLGGEIHFYMRILEEWQPMIEATIQSHYPDVEISAVEDYTEKIPKTVPNKNWNFYSEDTTPLRDDSYPIKTYTDFFEIRPEEVEEWKRIDPLYSLLEGLAKLQKGEQFWFQIIAAPITNKDIPFIDQGRKLADKIARRKEDPKQKSMLGEAAEILITGKKAEEERPKEVDIIPPEMKLTPGERKILGAIENKITKLCYKTHIRMLYICHPDSCCWGNYKILRSYLNHFATSDLNAFKHHGYTRTRIHYWLPERRLYLRQRKMFKNYIERMPPLFPRRGGKSMFPWGWSPNTKENPLFVLNTEELASLWHLPPKVIVPTMPYVETKKGGPPPRLPEE